MTPADPRGLPQSAPSESRRRLGVFRGALDVRAREINEGMKVAAAHAIAGTIADTQLSADYVVPSVFNRSVAPAVAAAVAQAAEETGVARRRHAPADA